RRGRPPRSGTRGGDDGRGLCPRSGRPGPDARTGHRPLQGMAPSSVVWGRSRLECVAERRSLMRIRRQLLPALVMVAGFGAFASAQTKKPAAKKAAATRVRVFFVEPK